jgi:hypothetical protein
MPTLTNPFTFDKDLTRIPQAMLRMGWHVAPKLMLRWLESPPQIIPAYGPPDTTSVRLDWVLSFPRARKAMDHIVSGKRWHTAVAQAVIRQQLLRQGAFQRHVVRFGNLNRPVPQIHLEQMQYAPSTDDGTLKGYLAYQCGELGILLYPVDELTGALGRFDFYFAVEGRVEPKFTVGRLVGHHIYIDRVGIYVGDSYSFENNAPLGRWDVGAPKSAGVQSGMTEIFEGDFREWRVRHNRGGDFRVFSNMWTLQRSPPDLITTQL